MADRKEYFRNYMAMYRSKMKQNREPALPKVVKTPAERMKEYRLRKKIEKTRLEFDENIQEMSMVGELQTPENVKLEENQEPSKKRFKAKVTAADLCKVVIDNNSSEEEFNDDDDDQTSSEDDQSDREDDSGEESESEIEGECGIRLNLFDRPLGDLVRVEYSGDSGLKVPTLGSQPRDYFNLLMKKSMYNLILKNTNAYANVVSNGNGTSASSWKPLKEDEMKKFVGLLLLMGVVRLPNVNLYWSNDRLFNFPSFREIMSLERFLAILHSLRFYDKSLSVGVDPLRKIRPLIEFFNLLMESNYTPQKELVMGNPMKIGEDTKESRFQVFTLREPGGMVQKYLIRKRTNHPSGQRRSAIARDLLEGMLAKGHSVFMGDYFSTVSLIQTLRAGKTYGTGQLRERNWKSFESMATPVNDEGVLQKFTEDGVCLVKWKDRRKEIVCVSSELDGSLIKASNDHRVKKLKPSALVQYERVMGGETDKLEELITSYPAGKKRLKWYRKIGLQIINVIMLNSYYLYRRFAQNKDMSLLKFKLDLIRALLYPNAESRELVQCPEVTGVYTKPHVLDYVGRNDKGFRKRKRCKYCISERGARVDSYYQCITCDNQPGFCLGQCFIKYHKYDLLL